MRKLASIVLLFCMLLSVSGCADPQGINEAISGFEVVESATAVKSKATTADSGKQKTSFMDTVQDN
ncbi:MAG: hypothetical protein LUG17_02030 [Clostridiales bacterium]|nr:hypothetical protein [Clostridiales bacterium]